MLRDKRVSIEGLSLVAPAAKLRKGDRYLLVVRSIKTGKLLASSIGTVT